MRKSLTDFETSSLFPLVSHIPVSSLSVSLLASCSLFPSIVTPAQTHHLPPRFSQLNVNLLTSRRRASIPRTTSHHLRHGSSRVLGTWFETRTDSQGQREKNDHQMLQHTNDGPDERRVEKKEEEEEDDKNYDEKQKRRRVSLTVDETLAKNS